MKSRTIAPLLVALLAAVPAAAVNEMVYDAEPNDRLQEAVLLRSPDADNAIRIIGELTGEDQDAYYWSIDEEEAGVLWNIRLEGRADAITRLDIYDLTSAMDGATYAALPELELSSPPPALGVLGTRDGSRPALYEGLLLRPGQYALGISHSGGSGSYVLEISQAGAERLDLVSDSNGSEAPIKLRNSRVDSNLGQAQTVYSFTISEDEAAGQWSLLAHTPLGVATSAVLQDESGSELLRLEGSGGIALRRSGLQLPAGDYRVVTERSVLAAQRILVEPGALAAEGHEVEPNDSERLAVEIVPGQPLSGVLGSPDNRDWFRFRLDAEQAQQRWEIAVTPADAALGKLRLCLQLPNGARNQCVDGAGDGTTVTLHNLGLPPGEYRLELDARAGSGSWDLAWRELGPVEPGQEVEPNGDQSVAIAWPDGRPVAMGHFHGRQEADFWRFTVSGEPQLWRVQLQGDDLFRLQLRDHRGVIAETSAGGATRIRLDNLFLTPGEYFVVATGSDSDYRLLLRPQGPPDPDVELEPNDEYQNALPLAFGQERMGQLSANDDTDLYQFSLAGAEHVRVQVRPAVDGAIGGKLVVGDDMQEVSIIHGGIGEELIWDMHLPAGDYAIELSPRTVSDAEYHLALARLPLFDGTVDREPNNYPEQASLVPPHGQIQGELGQTRAAEDWFRLAPAELARNISIPYVQGVRFALYESHERKVDLLTNVRDSERYESILEADREYLLRLTGSGAYAFNLFQKESVSANNDVASNNDVAVVTELPVEVDIRFDEGAAVQAFSPWQQVLHGSLALRNGSDEALSLNVDVVLSDQRWHLELEPGAWELAANASQQRAFTLVVPADAWGDRATRVNVRAVDALGRYAAQLAEVETRTDGLPTNPRYPWTLVPELRGGLNLAAQALGATVTESPGIDLERQGTELESLIDGFAEYGRYTGLSLQAPGDGKRESYPQPTIQLGGTEPVPVRGFLLNPVSTFQRQNHLRQFAIAVSTDGVNFETVLEAELDAAPIEQAFVLDAPREARYVRLLPLSNHSDMKVFNLGELKVIAEPGFVPAHLARPNLAEPALGGHLVWAEPWIRDSSFDKVLLEKDDEAHSLRLPANDAAKAEVVLGFHHSRAARVAGVSIDKLEGVAADSDVLRVSIARAEHSPLGPFETIGEWTLDATQRSLDFEQPVWARYLRFRLEGAEGARDITLPDRIAVWEAQADDSYRSILGEWGHYSSNGPLEAAHEPQYPGPARLPANDSRDSALALTEGESVGGAALLDNYASWYRLEVPAGDNTINLTLRGFPTLQARPELLDADGEVVLLQSDNNDPRQVSWQASVAPGSYWLRVFEPPRALMFSWDTSASVAWYLPSLSNALYRYAGQLRPERDVVNLLPFGHAKPLLQDWQGEPYPLKRLLGSYAHDSSSSAAESALAVASAELAERPPGKRGVILLTDAATSTDIRLWPALHAAHPMVFALAVTSEGALSRNPREEQDFMQEWSRVNGGVYQYVTSLGSLQQGFERAIARMRQPVSFEVVADYSYTEDPGPATLRVLSGEGELDASARGAVELILDASGSMLQRIGGERRIDIAKAAIAGIVENVLPDEVPLALRVYGHREAGSCRTDLEQPLAPLDKAVLLNNLARINAVNLAKTPIADSLARVAQDLADADGRRLVVLLTDGEETCDGDPAAVLQQLANDGIDVRLNVVGFAIDDENLKAEFASWAALGGGRYFDAGEADALEEALAGALQIRYTVKNSDGETVASGDLDGEAVEVPAGRYLVELDTQPPLRFRDVDLAPGVARELTIGTE